MTSNCGGGDLLGCNMVALAGILQFGRVPTERDLRPAVQEAMAVEVSASPTKSQLANFPDCLSTGLRWRSAPCNLIAPR